jgi:paraquat-inducible protein A
VIVPFGKAALVAWAMFMTSEGARRRTVKFVEAIAKWSMADVFVVALFITYLAAQASATPTEGPNAAPAMIAFTARVGPGFYWFAAYCLFSLASQQLTVRMVTSTEGEPPGLPERTPG